MHSQKATNIPTGKKLQLSEISSLWNKHWGQEGTAGPDSSDHGSAAGDLVPQDRQQVLWTGQRHGDTGALQIQHDLVRTVVNTL